MSLTAYVSRFVTTTSLDDVPEDVRHLAKRSILDGLGLAIAGARSVGAGLLRESVREQAGPGSATVLGTGREIHPRFAAFLNGFSIHADDYDDTQLAVATDRIYGLLTHPTAPVLPAILAIGEQADLSGADVLTAYLVGVEVETKVAEAIDPRHYQDGFHSTGTVGAIGAGAGSARLRGLDERTTAVALGIAASQSGGLRENFGTMTKPFHAGRAAESGFVAADLAERGLTAATDILEAQRGFFHAAGGGYDAASINGRLGQPWTFASPGISIKPHPSGSLTHPAMWAMQQLVREHDLVAADVERVTVGTNRHMMNALIHHRPTDELQAKFSMEFCMAILLLERTGGLAQFTDAVVNRPDVQDLIRRVEFGYDETAERAGYDKMTSIVRVYLRDGTFHEARADFGLGSPANPMSDEDLIDKFLGCLDWGGIPEDVGRKAAERILNLDTEPSIRDVVALLASASQEHRR